MQREISQMRLELARAARKSRMWLQDRQSIQVQSGLDESPTSMTTSKVQLVAGNLGKQAEILKFEEEAVAARRELSAMAEKLVLMEGKVLESNLTTREKQQPLEREIEMLKESVRKFENDAIAARLASESKDNEIALLKAKALKSEHEAVVVRNTAAKTMESQIAKFKADIAKFEQDTMTARKAEAAYAGKLAAAESKIRELQDELKDKASSLRLIKQDVEALRLAKLEVATPEKLPQPMGKIRDEQKLEQIKLENLRAESQKKEEYKVTARLAEALKEKQKFQSENERLQSEVEAMKKRCVKLSEQNAKMSRMTVQSESPTAGTGAGDASEAAALVGRLRREILLLQAELTRMRTGKKDHPQAHHPAHGSSLQQAGCLVQKLCCGANGVRLCLYSKAKEAAQAEVSQKEKESLAHMSHRVDDELERIQEHTEEELQHHRKHGSSKHHAGADHKLGKVGCLFEKMCCGASGVRLCLYQSLQTPR